MAPVAAIVEDVDLKVEEMCGDVVRAAERQAASLDAQMAALLARIPMQMRAMTIGELLDRYNGDLALAAHSSEIRMANDIATWVAATPKLSCRRQALADATNTLPGRSSSIARSTIRKGRKAAPRGPVQFETPRRVTRSQSIASAGGDDDAMVVEAAPPVVDSPRPKRATKQAGKAIRAVQRRLAGKVKQVDALLRA
ncbi:unnamed protein product (mitochondrion) [Plasmodiophora brassicae]|uniref:Borealin N-terminal domain-containing protein n=1 Tax=Plasmodiophora brassicae TaxID=37360 RepID=A0A3P3YP19_PLABS|nr:unnamed protein product [Plasmodiophora brassicae]